MASADFWRSIPASLDAGSTRQIARSPRVLRTHLHAYARRIYATVFRTRIGLCIFWPAHPTVAPLSASCSSRQRFASGFLPTPGHPGKPLPFANTCPCRLCRGLSPPSGCALPGAPKKRRSPRGLRRSLLEHNYLRTKAVRAATASKRPSVGPDRTRGNEPARILLWHPKPARGAT